MAACGSLQHIFEKPLPENPTLLESLSQWNQIKKNPCSIDQQSSSFTEIFGELHFKENSLFQTPSCPLLELDPKPKADHHEKPNKHLSPLMDYYSFSGSKYSGNSHKNCTEGLGFESSDEVDDLAMKEDSHDHSTISNWQRSSVEDLQKRDQTVMTSGSREVDHDFRRPSFRLGGEISVRRSAAVGPGRFPPPISSLSKSGKPRVWFKSYREEGRFVLKEIRVRSQEFLHACREDGRLKLHFVQQPNFEDGIPEEDGKEYDRDEDEDEDEEEDGGGGGDNGHENGYHQEEKVR